MRNESDRSRQWSHPPNRQRLTLSIAEVAGVLGLSERFVRSLVANGEISSIRIGRRVLIPAASLQRLVEEWTEASDE